MNCANDLECRRSAAADAEGAAAEEEEEDAFDMNLRIRTQPLVCRRST
jgi:hypothetical protein